MKTTLTAKARRPLEFDRFREMICFRRNLTRSDTLPPHLLPNVNYTLFNLYLNKEFKMKIFLLAVQLAASQYWAISAPAAVVSPTDLLPGSTITGLPNGASSGDGIPESKLFDQTENFSFSDGLEGTLRQRVIKYSDAPSSLHPGLYFDYEVNLLSGVLTAFTIAGYNSFATFVKECGISICGGSGASGIGATSASRASDGGIITFNFGNLITAGQHSANLQIFSSATLFQDPLASFTDSNGKTFSINAVGPAVAVPGPIAGAGLPTLLALAGLGWAVFHRRRFGGIAARGA